jgi:hypothetical protein
MGSVSFNGAVQLIIALFHFVIEPGLANPISEPRLVEMAITPLAARAPYSEAPAAPLIISIL